jgi:hypothetical protein
MTSIHTILDRLGRGQRHHHPTKSRKPPPKRAAPGFEPTAPEDRVLGAMQPTRTQLRFEIVAVTVASESNAADP